MSFTFRPALKSAGGVFMKPDSSIDSQTSANLNGAFFVCRLHIGLPEEACSESARNSLCHYTIRVEGE